MRILFAKKKKNISKKSYGTKTSKTNRKIFLQSRQRATHLVYTNPPFDDSRGKFIRMMLFVRFALQCDKNLDIFSIIVRCEIEYHIKRLNHTFYRLRVTKFSSIQRWNERTIGKYCGESLRSFRALSNYYCC